MFSQKELTELLSSIQNYYDTYWDLEETEEATQDTTEYENKLYTLFDTYLEARIFRDTLENNVREFAGNIYSEDVREFAGNIYSEAKVTPNYPKLPRIATLSELAVIYASQKSYIEKYDTLYAAYESADEIVADLKREISKIMPKYIWIPYNGKFFGIETGMWGGGTTITLVIKDDESKLYQLKHTNYYD